MLKTNKIKKAMAVSVMSLATIGSSVFSIPFVYAKDSDSQEIVTKATDEGSITITSNDQTKGKKLANAEFKVLKNGQALRFTKTDGNAYKIDANGSYTNVASDYYGNVKLVGLSAGDYTFEYTGNVMGYVAETNSVVIHVESNGTATGTFNFTKDEGNASISLKSEEQVAIPNAQFVILSKAGASLKFNLVNGIYIYSESGTETIKTNAGGMVTIKNIPSGSYTLKQTSAPEVYNGAYIVKDFSVSKGNTAAMNLINEKEYGNVYTTLRSNSNTILNNSNFEVIKSDGTKMIFEKTHNGYKYSTKGTVTSIPTTKNGDVLITGLPKGEYAFEQVKTSTGYDPIEKTSFTINKNAQTDVTLINNRSVGGVKISIIDKDSKKGVAGFEYTITKKDSETPYSFTLKDGTYVYDTQGNTTKLVSDENGLIKVSGIPTDQLIVSQVKNNPDYMSDNDKREITVNSKEETAVNVETSEAKAIISVKNAESKPVEGVKFVVLNKEGKEVSKTATNENGKIDLSSLDKGEYTYEMLGVPSGYSRITKKVKFNIIEKGKVDQLDEIILENAKIIVKLDKVDKKSPENATFTLTDKNTKKVIQTVKSNDKGVAEFQDLKYGEYIISQKSVPDGYKLIDDKVEVVIDEKYSNEDKVLFNNDGVVVEGQENSSNTIYYIIGGIAIVTVLIGGGTYFYIKKKKESSGNDEGIIIPNETQEEYPQVSQAVVEETSVDEEIPYISEEDMD